jgi:hypothetical protein
VQHNNADGFERELRNSAEKYLKGKAADVLVDIKFHSIERKDICEVIVRPSSKSIVLYDWRQTRILCSCRQLEIISSCRDDRILSKAV